MPPVLPAIQISDFSDEEVDADEAKALPTHSRSPVKDVRKTEQCSPMRSAKTYPEVIQPVRSWVAPAEVVTPVRGWTARAGSFVAEKMALFERLSAADNTTTVKRTTFLERCVINECKNLLFPIAYLQHLSQFGCW